MSLTDKQRQRLKHLQAKNRDGTLSDAELATLRRLKGLRSGSAGAGIANDTSGFQVVNVGKKPVYIGVDAGSDLEQRGVDTFRSADPSARSGPASFAGMTKVKPLYKVGYLHSKDFARLLHDNDPETIATYQQFMVQAGILDKYQPGELDAPTRAAFKELVTRANQHGGTWLAELDQAVNNPVVDDSGSKQQPDAFVANPDDPATLREAFQHAAQSIYGGDLSDDEVNAMVDSFRGIQVSKQKAAYDAQLAAANGGVPGSAEDVTSPEAFATEQIKARHPQQVNRVKFQDSLSTMMNTFSSQAPGQ